MPEVGVVVVSWNSAGTIAGCLASIPSEHPVVLVDNASEDDTVQRALAARPDVEVLAQTENLGFGAACNIGARALGDADVLLLNPDGALLAGCLELLTGVLAEDARVGMVGPRITDANGLLELSWGDDPTIVTEWRRQREQRSTERTAGARRSVDWVTGGCCLVSRAAWHQVQGFDQGYFLYFEDLDLCRRVRQAGYRIVFAPEAEATHVRGVSAGKLGARTEWHYRRSQLRYYRRYANPLARLVLKAYLAAKYAWKAMRNPEDRETAWHIARLAIAGGAS